MGRLRDAHIHIAEHGRSLWACSLEDCRSLAEALDTVAGAAEGMGPDEWVIASGAHPQRWSDQRLPLARELDEAGDGRPVVVNAFELHTMACSSAALRAAGIGPQTADPPKGKIVRKNGRPTGLLLEDAAWLVREVIPRRSDARYRLDVRYGLEDLARYGYGEFHEMLAEPRLVDALAELEREGVVLPRIRLYAPRQHFEEVRRRTQQMETSRVELGGLKLFADGTLHSRTALMLHPYVDADEEHPRGQAMVEPEELDHWFAEAGREGHDVAVHALGDGAVRMCLDAYERAGGSRRRAGFRLRVEHAQFIDRRDVERFVEMDVIASVQPCHLLVDVEGIHRFVPHRAHRAFPLRDLVEAARGHGREPSEIVWCGSDSPVVSPDPYDTLQAAVWRRQRNTDISTALAIEQALSEEETWALLRSCGRGE